MTLTYNPSLAKVKVNPNVKNQDRRSHGSSRRAQTNGQTDGRYQTYYLPSFAVDNNNLKESYSLTSFLNIFMAFFLLWPSKWDIKSIYHTPRGNKKGGVSQGRRLDNRPPQVFRFYGVDQL